MKEAASDNDICENAKCARPRKDADKRIKNCKLYLVELSVHIHSRNIPTAGDRFF